MNLFLQHFLPQLSHPGWLKTSTQNIYLALTLLSELKIIFFPKGKVHLYYYLNDHNCYTNCL